jgi:hypothetical protein
MGSLDLMNCFDSPKVRHGDVEKDDIRGQLIEEVEELKTVGRFPDDLQIRPRPEEAFQALPEQEMIICNDNTTRVH